MYELHRLARIIFKQIARFLAFNDAQLRRKGLRNMRTRAQEGPNGPELLMTAEGLELRFWTDTQGPGCEVQGAKVLGYLWSSLNTGPARCIGVFTAESDGIAWLAMAKGDFPAEGVIDIRTAAIRSGPDRLIELTQDLTNTAIKRFGVRAVYERFGRSDWV